MSSPDGKRVAFSSNQGPFNLFLVATSGGTAERLTSASEWQQPTDWSPDGRELLFSQQNANTVCDIWVLPLTGDRKPRPLVVTDASKAVRSSRPMGGGSPTRPAGRVGLRSMSGPIPARTGDRRSPQTGCPPTMGAKRA
ncbi:MAG: hypothetical protein DMF82_23045 [Acidobacteria bacterium]|nr:MAG: hypothetical protein DMF82_23045 [Acidobacteriota bacterium]